jgi:VanZ family protein
MTGSRRLSLYLAVAWVALAIYASLYPFAGWRDSGANPFAFLVAAWPRYYTGFDIGTNIAAYIPLGFFLCITGRRWVTWALSLAITVMMGLTLSLTLEIAQNFLPSRVASNLDLACNTGGVLLGALAAVRWGGFMLEHGRLSRLRDRLLTERGGVDSGLILLGLWLITQLDPAVISFGTGDLRRLLDLPPAQPFSAERFRDVETVVAATGLLAALMFASLLAASRQRRLLPLVLLALVLIIKTLAFALLMAPEQALAWATPGTLSGAGLAIILWSGGSRLVVPLQRALAALSLLLATAIVNLSPANPYLEYSLQLWNPGHFLNFHGLTQFAASVWPFLALPWLMLLSTKDTHDYY